MLIAANYLLPKVSIVINDCILILGILDDKTYVFTMLIENWNKIAKILQTSKQKPMPILESIVESMISASNCPILNNHIIRNGQILTGQYH